jgi:pyruvate/2-oxoglutarate dehydrogenase complex dihydrolipoamide dehydrogenase (E3) component
MGDETLEDRNCLVKFLVDKDDRILGCHIISSCAPIIIHEMLVAVCLSTGITNIAKIAHIHPALSEVVVWAATAFR